jgi:hypothetical protein
MAQSEVATAGRGRRTSFPMTRRKPARREGKDFHFSAALTIEAMARIYPRAQEQKSFGSFLQKRTPFL